MCVCVCVCVFIYICITYTNNYKHGTKSIDYDKMFSHRTTFPT